MSYATDVVGCSKDGCDASFPNHKWGSIKAHHTGWYQSKRGIIAYCPAHVPGWVAEWRTQRVVKEESDLG